MRALITRMQHKSLRSFHLPEETFFNTKGRRKSAIARVRLKIGSGNIIVNGRRADEYFGSGMLLLKINQPFDAIDGVGRYDIVATLKGGGVAGQAGALRHGIARALEKLDPGNRPKLKKGGFLTRDARVKERKKYGQKGARARFQFSKR